MSIKEAVQKQRAAFGFNEAVKVEADAEAAQAPQSVNPLDAALTQEQQDFLHDYRAKLESDPRVQKLNQDLVVYAIKEERARLGLTAKP